MGRTWSRRDWITIVVATGVGAGAGGFALGRSSVDQQPAQVVTQTTVLPPNYAIVSNDEIGEVLRKFPPWLERHLKQDYGVQSDEPLRLRRTVVKNPAGIMLELGTYSGGVIEVPSIWLPQTNDGLAFEMKSGIVSAVPHEVGHHIHLTMMDAPGYQGPSRANLEGVVGELAQELRDGHREREWNLMKAQLAYPEIAVHNRIVSAGLSDYQYAVRWLSIERIGDAGMREEFQARYAEIESIGRAIQPVLDLFYDFMRDPLPNLEAVREAFPRTTNIPFYEDMGRMIGLTSSLDRDVERQRFVEDPSAGSRMIFLRGGLPYGEMVDVYDASLREVQPISSEEKAALFRKLEARFEPVEVVANCVANLHHGPIGIFEGGSRERFNVPNGVLDMMGEMQFEGDHLLRPMIDEYGEAQTEKNGIAIVGEIPYAN